MNEPQDPIMRHMLGYIRRMERVHDGVDYGRIVADARGSFPRESNQRIDSALISLYNLGYIERRYDGRYEIPEN